IGSAVPFINHHKVLFAVIAILVLASMNLRGNRESGTAFAIPTYAFMIGMYIMLAWGLFQIYVLGNPLRAESADFTVHSEHGEVLGFAMVFLVARAFSSGCAALTGVEAISNGVPAFRKPKSRNAATTLLMLGLIAVSLFMGIVMLAKATGAKIADSPEQLIGAPPGYHQKTLIAQLADAVFHDFPIGLYLIAGVTALILVLAANTAFNGFPVLGSILAQDRYLPRQLHTRGDRLAFSNGILFLAFAAIAFVVAFRAQVTALIQLYIVGVFVSFTLSQIGMVRHWTRLLRVETDSAARRHMLRSRVINAIGCVCTGAVLIIVVVTKFLAGAWIAILAMSALFVIMKMIHRHYDAVANELERQAEAQGDDMVLPSRNHAVVLVSKLHLPTKRALAYARATRPDVLEAITVSVDDAETRELVHHWEDSDISVPLKVIASPYREITRPVLDYVKRVTKESPRTVVTVFIPEYVVGHWWEQVLHNQSALRLKGRLLFEPNVMVTSVPWQLSSSERLKTLQPHAAPGDARRGFLD
ncbi:MAG TPA: APC family permease, partial [Mycobacterium sp.]|nr:APC family permease [Mycobacterium sp.]